jgi:hypothetical protein
MPFRSSLGHFVPHLVEMVLVMLVGMAVLDRIVTGGFALVGYAAPVEQLPELSTLVMAVEMAVPMALRMSWRGQRRRLTAEMVVAMVAPAVVLAAAVHVGALPRPAIHMVYHPVMYAAMLAAMLLRYREYSMPMSGHAGGHTPVTSAGAR